MNWTGGRLHRHAKSNSNNLVKTQREHFAKARLLSQLTSTQPVLLDFPLFENPHVHHDNAISATSKTRTQPSLVKKQTEKPEQCRQDHLEKQHANTTETSSKLAHVSAVKHLSANDQAFHSIETAKRNLLDRPDWLGTAIARPAPISFSPQRRMYRIARHRKIASMVKSQCQQHDGREASVFNEKLRRTGKRKYGRHSSGKDSDIESGSSSNQSHASYISRRPPYPDLFQSQSDISTSSLLVRKFEAFVKEQEKVIASPDPISSESVSVPNNKIKPRLVPLDEIRHFSSFDEARQQLSLNSAHLSNKSVDTQLQEQDFQDDARTTETRVSGQTFEEATNDSLATRSYDPKLSRITQPNDVFDDVTKLSQELLSTMNTIAFQGRAHRSLDTGFGSSRDSVSSIEDNPERNTCTFEIDHQFVDEKIEPAMVCSTISADGSTASSTYHRLPKGASVGTPPYTRVSLASRALPFLGLEYYEGGLDSRMRETTHLRPQKRLAISHQNDSAPTRGGNYSCRALLALDNGKKVGRDSLARESLQDENEAWVNSVFADDLGRVQRDFRFPDTPAQKPKLASIRPRSSIESLGRYDAQLHTRVSRLPDCAYKGDELTRSTDIPIANIVTGFAQIQPADTQRGDMGSDTDVFIQTSQVKSISDEQIRSWSTHNNVSRSGQGDIELTHTPRHLFEGLSSSTKSINLKCGQYKYVGAGREASSGMRNSVVGAQRTPQLFTPPNMLAAAPLHKAQYLTTVTPSMPTFTRPRQPTARLSRYSYAKAPSCENVAAGCFHLIGTPKIEKAWLQSDLRSSSYLLSKSQKL